MQFPQLNKAHPTTIIIVPYPVDAPSPRSRPQIIASHRYLKTAHRNLTKPILSNNPPPSIPPPPPSLQRWIRVDILWYTIRYDTIPASFTYFHYIRVIFGRRNGSVFRGESDGVRRRGKEERGLNRLWGQCWGLKGRGVRERCSI